MIQSIVLFGRATGPLPKRQMEEWPENIVHGEKLLALALSQGYSIILSWPSGDGNCLNVVLHKADE